MTTATSRLLDYCRQAKDIEGKVIRIALADGDLCVLFQRERRRNGRLEDGQIDSMLWRLTFEADGIASIGQQVEQDLLYLQGIALDLRVFWCPVSLNLNVPQSQLLSHQGERRANHLMDADDSTLLRGGSPEAT